MYATSLLALALGASSVLGATHTVLVGSNSTKTFDPSEITADVGDTVTFSFVGGNHTASQSTFAAPCTNAGFKSGFIPGSGAAANASTFSILVNDTTPIWVYCAQTGHCEAGMVMSINAATTGNKTFSAFQAAAMGSTAAADTNGTATATATGTSTKTKGGSSSTATDSSSSNSTGSGSGSSSNSTKTKAKSSTSTATDGSASGTAASDTSGSTSAAAAVVALKPVVGVLGVGVFGLVGAVVTLF